MMALHSHDDLIMMIKATATDPRPTTTDAPSGVDVSVTLTLALDDSDGGGSREISGTITLVPDPRDDRSVIAYGDEPAHWVGSDLLREIRRHDAVAAREMLDRMLEAGVGEVLGLGPIGASGVSSVL